MHVSRMARRSFLACVLGANAIAADLPAPVDTFADAWPATDALGRQLPMAQEVGPPRQGKLVGIFYFLWLGRHGTAGPYDISRILAADPTALSKPDGSLWGPLHYMHHWGESLFGYYFSDDTWVIRKHAQMLSDAGVDAIVFDVSNQLTYPESYVPLCKTFVEVRRDGGRTPQFAFLCPFWDPARVVARLYKDLYGPGLAPELWFRWKGKPLILADPAKITPDACMQSTRAPEKLAERHTLGQSFTAAKPFKAAGGSFPTWNETESGVTLSLHADEPGGKLLARKRFEKIADNATVLLDFPEAQPAGTYYLEQSDGKGSVGWWSASGDVYDKGRAYADGKPVGGARELAILFLDAQKPEVLVSSDAKLSRAAAEKLAADIRGFFTFRRPQPDYFQGPTGPDQWGWLEVFPQHVFKNSEGKDEQMTVGVGQNATGRRLSAFSVKNTYGRSWHDGKKDERPDAVLHGYNLAEQFERALKMDPEFVFITGWNEWIAGRFNEFCGVREPVMFVDQYTEEYSRDVEPMKGGHGDNYYYQMIGYVRRYKGARKPPPAGMAKTIEIDGDFSDWKDVLPEYRDDRGDTMQRDFVSFDKIGRYTNTTGRNDFVLLKAARDERFVYFYAQTAAPMTPRTDPNWMMLFIATNAKAPHWEGYNFVVNRQVKDATTALEECKGGWDWKPVVDVRYCVKGHEMELAIPRAALHLDAAAPLQFDFKWADNIKPENGALDFFVNGDVAPNGRFRYRFAEEK
ncbi:MAG: hypothetical protein NTW87_26415 [Planctomycetota bacterium]|nr:hypothetical protein [Planctomycetota bacterium]